MSNNFCKTTCLFLLPMILLSTKLLAAPSDHFVTTWETTVGDTIITIPTFPGETYSYAIDWDNDMVPDETGITGDATHDYGVAGVHTIRIFGTFPQIYFNNSGDKDKILSIDQWGTNSWASMDSAFEGTSNLINKASDIPNLSNVVTLLQMFFQASSIGSPLDTGNWNWDISNVTAFGSMFDQATLFNKDIGNWDTTNAEIFSTMFQNASSFNQDISNWSTANVISMGSMFNHATSFNQDLSGWNFEAVFLGFNNFLIDTPFSTENYDALLIAWDNQNVHSGLLLIVGTISYCSQAAVDARANLTTNDGWMITDGGHTNACDVLFENSFENVIVVKTARKQITYDFSKINPDTLGYQPEIIIKGLDDNNKVNMKIHIRNDLGIFQVRASYLRDKKWLAQQWITIENNKTITLQW